MGHVYTDDKAACYLMCVCADRHPEGPRQTKVSQLDLSLSVDEQVLGLQVPMKNPVRVAEGQALQQLEEITLQTHKRQVSQKSREHFLPFHEDPHRVGCNSGGGLPSPEVEGCR